MWRVRTICVLGFCLFIVCTPVEAQQVLTWQQIKEKFEAANPTLRAGRIGIDESKAQEITAYLRPNPDFTVIVDQFALFPDPISGAPYRPLAALFPLVEGSYLHERHHKRELRRESARKATDVAVSSLEDQERNLLFTLRGSFVQALQAKSVLALARENLAYWDHVLDVSRDRFKAGDISQLDLDRLEIQRATYESDAQTAEVNVRTAKIQLLNLLNDRTPIDQFDISGAFDFSEQLGSLDEFRREALDSRPDLKAALLSVDKAKTDHQLAVANGSTDPTFGADLGRNPPLASYVGFSMNIPLRFFDKNQGEKLRTQLDISRSERLLDANQSQVFSDVDSAYTTLNGTLNLLRPYKTKYLVQAARVRDTVSFAYQRGGVSLLDFLNAQSDYRTIQVAYLNLVGTFLNAASQLNLAVGREVIQ
jgi:outer membrane protein, heavy metal efflux system